ncbi:MAG: efflux RND transporter periplasmic adaptor subunit [Flammeovirgaceae bacterium]
MKNLKLKDISFLVFGLFLIVACGKEKEQSSVQPSASKPINVKVINVKATNQPLPIISSGVLSSKSETKLSFKVGGIIEQIFVEEGQRVRKGQLLARLEQAEINARVRQAQSAVDKSERDLKRAQNLYADSVATLEQVQNAKTGLEVAASNLKIALFNQKYAAIYAPSNGKVLKRFAERQELIGPGTPVFFIGATTGAQVIRIGLADKDVVRLKIGDKAEVTFDAYRGETFSAKVSELAASSDPRTGTFEVELTLAASDLVLKKGFVGKVKIYPSNQASHYRLPLGALVEATHDRAYVYTPSADGQKATRLMVRPLDIGSNFFVVPADDLKGANQVIMDGNMYLGENTAIRIEGNIDGMAIK